MATSTRTNLGAVVARLADRLNRSLSEALREALARGRQVPGGGAPREITDRILERFWRRALGRWQPLPASASTFYPLLHEIWTNTLYPEAAKCFAPQLSHLSAKFSGVQAVDGRRLSSIVRRLRAQDPRGPAETLGEVKPAEDVCVQGRLTAFYDIFRGIVVRLRFEPDADRSDSEWLETEVGALARGTLLIGDGRLATAAIFRRLHQGGAHGAFRVGQRADFRQLHNCIQRLPNGYFIEDGEVELESPACRVRRVALVGAENTRAIITDVLDPEALSQRAALQLAVFPWRLERMFLDVMRHLDFSFLESSDPQEVKSHIFAVALLNAAFRTAQGWMAAERGLPPAALSPDFLFGRLARAAITQVSEQRGGRRTEPEDGAEAGDDAASQPFGENGGPLLDGLDCRGPIATGDPCLGIAVAGPLRRVPGELYVGQRRPDFAPASADEVLAIRELELDAEFLPFCRDYGEVGHRDPFLWQWVQRVVDATTLSSMDPAWRGACRTVKLLGVMLCTLLDDVADNHKDGEFLSTLLRIPYSPGPRAVLPQVGPKGRYYKLIERIWDEIVRRVEMFPRYQELKDVLEFDYRQLFNTMRYSLLVNRMPELLNPLEHDLYQPHNMHMMITGTVDLMCSPEFDRYELPILRQALWRGQLMGRIGNMVSTWEREIGERDFSSGVFAAAVDWGVVKASELSRLDPAVLRSLIRSSGIIPYLLSECERLVDEIHGLAPRVRTVDLVAYGLGLEVLIRNYLGCRV